ncbi:hypothetical protein ACIG5E_29595 [Kitasatospora sp. NPDC053057]|uniref:hypothetical protein n=1 Tax=Kitasatospora sp. NPDC053057 TaxID=3364062 RepID=UPI0037CB0BB5
MVTAVSASRSSRRDHAEVEVRVKAVGQVGPGLRTLKSRQLDAARVLAATIASDPDAARARPRPPAHPPPNPTPRGAIEANGPGAAEGGFASVITDPLRRPTNTAYPPNP